MSQSCGRLAALAALLGAASVGPPTHVVPGAGEQRIAAWGIVRSSPQTGRPGRTGDYTSERVRSIVAAVVFFFRRETDSLACETRLNPDGPGLQLVVTQNVRSHIEAFKTLAAMLAREHELLQAWRAQGWQEVGAPLFRSRRR